MSSTQEATLRDLKQGLREVRLQTVALEAKINCLQKEKDVLVSKIHLMELQLEQLSASSQPNDTNDGYVSPLLCEMFDLPAEGSASSGIKKT